MARSVAAGVVCITVMPPRYDLRVHSKQAAPGKKSAPAGPHSPEAEPLCASPGFIRDPDPSVRLPP
ncbi:hypothetical protein GCM10017687_23930 [Streptomyces echinatus]